MPYSTPSESPSVAKLFDMSGRTALVVGGAGLLGGEISYALAELGAEVLIASRDVAKAEAFTDTLAATVKGAKVHATKVDITEPKSIDELIAWTRSKTGGSLDILVNSGWSGRKNTFE